jgi:aerobic carbon-monoxide dehydrogenase medium subunit
VKAARFGYARAFEVDDAVRDLAQGQGASKVLGGSQSLGPMLNLRLARPVQVIDIAQIAALRTVQGTDESVEIGAAVTHAQIEDGVFAPLACHPLRAVAAAIAYRAIRTRGTMGGSLAHADPAADWVVTLAAIGARIRVKSQRGERTIPAEAFMVGAYTTLLEFDELIVCITVPAATASMRWGYHKICRKPGEFAEASAAVYFDASRNIARIVLGAVDGPPILLKDLAASIANQGPPAAGPAQLRAAVAAALPDREPIELKWFAVCIERALAKAGVLDNP